MSPLALSLRFLQTQPDDRLVTLARDGHERAFEALVRRYRAPLLAYCARVAPRGTSPEDILQQALLQAWKALAAGSEVREARAWLYRIVHNVAISTLRAAGELPEERYPAAGSVGVDQLVEQRLAAMEALAGLAALPEPQRQVMLSTALDGRSHEEIAEALGLSSGSVRGLIYRARATLRAAAAAVIPGQAIAWAARGAHRPGRSARIYETIAGGGSAGLAGAGSSGLIGGSAGIGGIALKGGAVLAAGTLAGAAAFVATQPVHHRPAAHRAPARPVQEQGSVLAAAGSGGTHAAASTHNGGLQASRSRAGPGDRSSSGTHRAGSEGSGRGSDGRSGSVGGEGGGRSGGDGGLRSGGGIGGSSSGGDRGGTPGTTSTDGGSSSGGGSGGSGSDGGIQTVISSTSSSDGGMQTSINGGSRSDGGSSGGISSSDGGMQTTTSGTSSSDGGSSSSDGGTLTSGGK